MEKFADLRFPDQVMIVVAVLIVVLAVATMIVVGSESLKRWVRRRLIGLVAMIESFNDKYFSDDEPYDEEWMDEDQWKRTRI